MKVVVFLLPVFFWKYQSTAINFFTDPEYRGTALGFEISVIHLLAVSLLLAMILRQWPVKVFFPGLVLYILYFLVSLLSVFFSPATMYSGFELFKMLNLLITFLALANYFYMTHEFDSFLLGVSTVIFINFLICMEMKYITGIVQVYGLFPHQNSMGMFMSLIGPVFLARVINKNEHIIKTLFFLFIFLISFLSALFTYSRGAIACFPFGCLITIVLTGFFHRTTKALLVLSVTGVLGLFTLLYSFETIVNRFTKAPEASAETRQFFAEVAYNIIKDTPLLGCGVNTWIIVASEPRYNPYLKHKYFFSRGMGIVETTYLLVGAECGLLGLASLLCWYFYYLLQALYLSFRWRKTPYFYLLVGLTGGFASNYLQSTLEWVLKQQINYLMLFWCFGIVAALIQSTREHTFLSRLAFIKMKSQLRHMNNSQFIPQGMPPRPMPPQ
ncbi:MAG: O-antigen ligase family protein [Victivallales bacterium]|nr:O-antigen ligase family protein [Victivallales bacterium]